MCSDIAVRAVNLSKRYRVYETPQDRLKQFLWRGRKHFFREVTALDNVSFTIKRGETVGIIGRNGSGKSTLLQLLCGTLERSEGFIEVNGRISALLELGAGFNPDFTGRENVYLNGKILGLSQQDIDAKYEEIVAFSGIGDMVEQPVKTYSSGMYVRLAFSVAVAADPDILIVDEALAVGDEMFQRKCFGRIRAIQERGGTILFVSHSAATVVEICNRVIFLDSGEQLVSGVPKSVISLYHKYIFAPAERAPAVREYIKSLGTIEKAEELVLPQGESGQLDTGFDPSLVPESRVSYESHGALIENPEIIDTNGDAANLLVRRQSYSYRYRVRFSQQAFGVRFGMLIKTKSGFELGGIGTATDEYTIPVVEAGSVIEVRFRFSCMLLPGMYFINCGCSGINGEERIFLHRIVDAALFRVLPEAGMREGGVVDFSITTSVTECDQDSAP
jgi:lipopolysaccharide transport system ATP-binding protein